MKCPKCGETGWIQLSPGVWKCINNNCDKLITTHEFKESDDWWNDDTD